MHFFTVFPNKYINKLSPYFPIRCSSLNKCHIYEGLLYGYYAYTHNSAAKAEPFSTSTYMMVQRKTSPTMGEQPEWEDPNIQNNKAI